MLDWIFEAIVDWVGRTVTKLMDAVSGLFLDTLGTDMLVMEEYFPFVSKAFTVMQYTAWALLFLITVWQLFKSFAGPLGETEHPATLVIRSIIFSVIIGYSKPIFLYVLDIARAPYTALLELPVGGEAFTFAGVEEVLRSGLVTVVSSFSSIGSLLIIILMVTLGWNYFKLLLEVVERYVVVGVLCYTSPLAYAVGASKSTLQVFKSWCRMIGAQLLLLVMNVWFLRGFNSSMGRYIATGGALSNGRGSIFLWLFCAIAFLRIAQRFDSYLSALGLNVAQTGQGLGMEILMAAKTVGSMRGKFVGGTGGKSAPVGRAQGVGVGFANRFKGNSFIRDSVVSGGSRMGAGGGIGFVGRIFGGVAARNGANLTGESVASVASCHSSASGSIGGDIADRSLQNFMPSMSGYNLSNTSITGGHISTSVLSENGGLTEIQMFSASSYDKPEGAYSVMGACDGSKWYALVNGDEMAAFYDAPNFEGNPNDTQAVAEIFPNAPNNVVLRTVDEGEIEATTDGSTSLWYNSAYYEKPAAPHSTIISNSGVLWYAMAPNAELPEFENNEDAYGYNQAKFREFMPGFERRIATAHNAEDGNGYFEVRHEDGTATRFYDATRYNVPRGNYTIHEDFNNNQWYGIKGENGLERKPVYENGKPVYDGDEIRSILVETVRYRNAPIAFDKPKRRTDYAIKPPRNKR